MNLLIAVITRMWFSSTLLWRKAVNFARFPLLAPRCKVRRVQAFSSEEGAYFTSKVTCVCLYQDVSFILRREVSSFRLLQGLPALAGRLVLSGLHARRFHRLLH